MEASQVAKEISSDEFRELVRLVKDLDRRVSSLERGVSVEIPESSRAAVPELHVSSDLIPTIGKVLLAIAGAFVLRALTEAHVWPPLAGVVAGLLYAAFWLWRAMRIEPSLAATMSLITSLLILIPLTFEATLRLQIVPAWAVAAALAAWSIAPIRRRSIAAIASAVAALTGFALLIGTHDLLPFTLALIAIAAVSDWVVLSARWVAAVCAAAAVGVQTIIVANPLPEGYAPVSRGGTVFALAALFAVLAGSFAVRGASRRDALSFYEIAKTTLAIVGAIEGLWFLTRADVWLGIAALITGAGSYVLSVHAGYLPRNTNAFAAFGALLGVSGMFMLLSLPLAVVALCLFAVGISWTALGAMQAPVFLWIALWISGVATGSALVLFGAGHRFPQVDAAMILAAGAIVLFKIDRLAARIAVLAGLVWAASGLAASLGVGSIVLPTAALLLAWTGLKWRRRDPIWMMYAVMAVGAAKIIMHDFANESTVVLVTSLLAYGAALISLPRIVPRSRSQSDFV